jgi:hypothetical protein
MISPVEAEAHLKVAQFRMGPQHARHKVLQVRLHVFLTARRQVYHQSGSHSDVLVGYVTKERFVSKRT